MGLPRCLEVRVFTIKALGAFPESCCIRKTLKNFPLVSNTVFQYSWTFCLSEMTVTLMSFMGVYLKEGFGTLYCKIMAVLPTWLLHLCIWADSFVFFHLYFSVQHLNSMFLQLGLWPLQYRSGSVLVGWNNIFLKLPQSLRVLFH